MKKQINTKLINFYKVFADQTRLQILFLLLEGRYCVNHIAIELEISPSAISHQLRLLRQLDLVRAEKVGKEVYYSLSDDHIKTILKGGMDHVGEGDNYEG